MLVNAITGIGNLFLGFRLTSVWFIIAASYYLIMCAARAQTVRLYQKSRLLTDKSDRYETEFTVYSDCGILVCLSGLSYFFICLRLFFLGEYKEYTRIVVICSYVCVQSSFFNLRQVHFTQNEEPYNIDTQDYKSRGCMRICKRNAQFVAYIQHVIGDCKPRQCVCRNDNERCISN